MSVAARPAFGLAKPTNEFRAHARRSCSLGARGAHWVRCRIARAAFLDRRLGGSIDRLVTIEGATTISPEGWSPDGRTLVFSYVSRRRASTLGTSPGWQVAMETALQQQSKWRSPLRARRGQHISGRQRAPLRRRARRPAMPDDQDDVRADDAALAGRIF